MNKLWLSVCLVIAGSTVVSAADFATKTLNATHKLFHEDSTGTCFFVRNKTSDRSLFLVTAAHVLDRTEGETAIVVLREAQDDGNYRRRDHKITIRQDNKPLWTPHPTADAAVIQIAEPLTAPVSTLRWEDLADEARLIESGLHICDSVFVLTYPERFEANSAGLAVARQGIIASHLLHPFRKHRTFLVDFTTFSGDSGGPVFVAGTDGQPLVLGMVLANYRHDEHVKTEYEERTIHHPLGLGRVLHSQFIRDTIELASKLPVTVSHSQ